MSTTEKPKAVKAPAKPRKAASKTPVAKTTSTKTAAAKTKVAAAPPAPVVPTHHEIALLAEKYWAERGWQDGAAEQDWLRAEQELMKLAS